MILKQVALDIPAADRGLHRAFRIEVRAVRAREALAALQYVGAAGEASRRQLGAHHPVVRSLARVQRLAHGAEHRFQPGGLGAGDAQRGGEFIGVQAHQVRAGGGGAEAADRGGGMEAQHVVMPGGDHPANAALQLVARDECGQHVGAGRPAFLRQRQQRGQDGDRGMARHRQVHVIEIQRMRRGAVHKRGGCDGQFAGMTQ